MPAWLKASILPTATICELSAFCPVETFRAEPGEGWAVPLGHSSSQVAALGSTACTSTETAGPNTWQL
ncbi:hypothetical protein a10_07491 [Streptomyces acidiscabies]|nr:hypothetical protein a10_07491 [Streptomyces acidiscabies]GAV44167.1 hypothetical protein Saa2_07127 [Streptomyces acidiscabies]